MKVEDAIFHDGRDCMECGGDFPGELSKLSISSFVIRLCPICLFALIEALKVQKAELLK